MTIACTRCGATQDGDIILPPIAFGFKHNSGCGHGVGPLAVLPGSKPKKIVTDEGEFKKVEGKSADVIVTDEGKEAFTKQKKIKEKLKVFGKREKSDG